MQRRGKTFIVSGPSGVGKSTVLKALFDQRTDLYFSISATTRDPRPGEVDGVHYHFTPAEEFHRMVEEDVPCEDILSQLNAAKSALHKCGQVVLEGHIQHCVRDGIQHGDADKTIESFTKAVERFSNMG